MITIHVPVDYPRQLRYSADFYYWLEHGDKEPFITWRHRGQRALDKQKVREIRHLYDTEPWGIYMLSHKFRVCGATIYAVLTCRSHKDDNAPEWVKPKSHSYQRNV